MTHQQYMNNLKAPDRKIDCILDTDTYNEIDDQYALCYMLRSTEKLNVVGITAAPFSGNGRSKTPGDGMEKSFEEIMRLLDFLHMENFKKNVYKGSVCYLPDEKTPVKSDAAEFIANTAKNYTSENPLYIVAIGAITNVASAILMAPEITEKIVIVWLGGHDIHDLHIKEFNMFQDVAGARVVFGCKAPFVQVPCCGVVDRFTITPPELKEYFEGKNELCNYLAGITRKYMESNLEKSNVFHLWTKVIWDVVAVAWLLNDNERFMKTTLMKSPIPQYDGTYSMHEDRHLIRCVRFVKRDALLYDLIEKLTK